MNKKKINRENTVKRRKKEQIQGGQRKNMAKTA